MDGTNKRIDYLLIGSAPYIKTWYAKRGRKLVRKGHRLVAINNAWAIDPENVHWWIHSSDFHVKGTLHPSDKQKKKFIVNMPPYLKNKLLPYCYDLSNNTGTMILNALVMLLNHSVCRKIKCDVYVAGADCIYKGERDHFYPGGTADPLRYGAPWLVNELKRMRYFYDKEKCGLYNIGGQPDSLLPFKRRR